MKSPAIVQDSRAMAIRMMGISVADQNLENHRRLVRQKRDYPASRSFVRCDAGVLENREGE